MLRLFRFADFWNRKPLENSADRIERALLDRTRRLVAGIHVDESFEFVSGSLVVARGRGKSLRVLFCDSLTLPVPAAVGDNCLQLLSEEAAVSDLRSCSSELADVQCAVVDQLKLKAGKYVDRILALAVSDPGLWQADFDGAMTYSSLCDATRLAERTGISVIDAWPNRDMAVGGKGFPLDPLCHWLLAADRDRRIALQANFSVTVQQRTRGYLLPPSDGLDAEVPALRPFATEGMDLVEGLLQISFPERVPPSRIRQLLVSGVHAKELLACWNQIASEETQRTTEMLRCAAAPEHAGLSAEQLLCTAMKWISDQCQAKIQASLAHLKADYDFKRSELKAQIESSKQTRVSGSRLLDAFDRSLPNFEFPGRLMVDAWDPISDTLVSRLQNHFTETQVTGCWSSFLHQSAQATTEVAGPALMSALLGFMHIDQMTANVPLLTGAQQQRILGRLTPGRPNAWRNLLREMGDHEPSAMKLRDAV